MLGYPRRWGNLKALRLLIQSLLLGGVSLSTLWGDKIFTQDMEIASLYSRHAWEAWQEGRWEEFGFLVDQGLSYNPTNPDLMGFKGILYMNTYEFSKAETWLTDAYYSNTLTEYLSKKDILARLFEIHYRSGNDAYVETLYSQSSVFARDDPSILFYTAMSLRRTGHYKEAEELAIEGAYRYQDQRFLIALVGWQEDSPFLPVLSESVLQGGLRYPDLMVRQILSSTTTNPEALAWMYMGLFQDINSWYFRKVLFELPVDEFPPPDFSDSQRVWPLTSLQLYLTESPTMDTLFENTSYIALDSENDGISNVVLRKEEDSITWEVDFNQDGNVNLLYVWTQEGELRSLTVYGSYQVRRYDYYVYPYVERILFNGDKRNQREYLYLPRSYSLPLIPEPENLLLYVFKNLKENISNFAPESEFLARSYSLVESVSSPEGATPFRTYTIINGSIVRFEEDSNFDGTYDRIVLLESWLPNEGYRDITGNGLYDVREVYDQGRLIGFEYNGEDARLFEYQTLWNQQQFQFWDFSKNGFYDAFLTKREGDPWEVSYVSNESITGP